MHTAFFVNTHYTVAINISKKLISENCYVIVLLKYMTLRKLSLKNAT